MNAVRGSREIRMTSPRVRLRSGAPAAAFLYSAAGMAAALSISNLTKTYASGRQALSDVSLEVRRGEIFALLGPNGAGKTTLINIVCGIVRATQGHVLADGHDIVRDYRAARQRIGLVPQELMTDMFESVGAAVRYSREVFGRPPDPCYLG